jgi:hypothetical protein
MAGVGVVFVAFVVVAPLALYWFVREEDPNPDQTTSWGEARANATEDRFGDGARSGRESRRDESARRAGEDERGEKNDRQTRDDRDDGNHWG